MRRNLAVDSLMSRGSLCYGRQGVDFDTTPFNLREATFKSSKK